VQAIFSRRIMEVGVYDSLYTKLTQLRQHGKSKLNIVKSSWLSLLALVTMRTTT